MTQVRPPDSGYSRGAAERTGAGCGMWYNKNGDREGGLERHPSISEKGVSTMRITISGKHLSITDPMRRMAEKKIGKLERYFDPDTEATVIMSLEREQRKVEVTIPFGGIVLRGEESTDDMQKSVETVVRKLVKQIHHYRTRLERRLREGAFRGAAPEEEAEEADSIRVVRIKRFNIKPQDIEEAAMQMRLLGHSFYVFRSAETNQINVLYQRRDGSLGLIEPD